MNRNHGRPVRIAHAYGNRRDKIEAAAKADIDFLEADVWYRAGELWVRHERRLGPIPLLYDRRPPGVNSIGPWALPVSPIHYLRLDVKPLRLTELLDRTEARRGLLLDLKGSHSEEGGRAYAETLAGILDRAQPQQPIIVCGQSEVPYRVREVAPQLDVRHSIQKGWQWESFLRSLEAANRPQGVCMHRRFLTDEISQFLIDNGLQVFCWTVDDPDEARRLLAIGVDGIISNSLPLLERLKGD